MKLLWTEAAWNDYQTWGDTDRQVLQRVNTLIKELQRTPFGGVGKPEPLVGGLKVWWSRRIASEHRLIYRVTGSGDDQRVEIAACRYHRSRRG